MNLEQMRLEAQDTLADLKAAKGTNHYLAVKITLGVGLILQHPAMAHLTATMFLADMMDELGIADAKPIVEDATKLDNLATACAELLHTPPGGVN